MSRPAVTVVMPFAGDAAQARAAAEALLAIETGPEDELILADNGDSRSESLASLLHKLGAEQGTLRELGGEAGDRIRVVPADGERSPAHARNVGAEQARNDWILFLDADCRPSPGLLDAYFAEPVGDDIGALAGEVHPAPEGLTLAARYGAARGFLNQEAHLAHPYRPRAVAANLIVRRTTFEQLGGFYEGVRAAEDTDFSWRLQQAGWRLALRRRASVEHRYRTTVGELRRQWRGYAAGRAWLGRRYEGFAPEPAVRRALVRGWRRRGGSGRRRQPATADAHSVAAGRLERVGYLGLDVVLAAEELTGFALSNRPAEPTVLGPALVVLVTDRFPMPGDPLAEFAQTLERARVEAASRPETISVSVARILSIAYREDDGACVRALALLRLTARHPLRCAHDLVRGRREGPALAALAPAALRLQRDPGARVHALGGDQVRATSRRLAALTGRSVAD